jgi:hypothetical protein
VARAGGPKKNRPEVKTKNAKRSEDTFRRPYIALNLGPRQTFSPDQSLKRLSSEMEHSDSQRYRNLHYRDSALSRFIAAFSKVRLCLPSSAALLFRLFVFRVSLVSVRTYSEVTRSESYPMSHRQAGWYSTNSLGEPTPFSQKIVLLKQLTRMRDCWLRRRMDSDPEDSFDRMNMIVD